MPEHDPEGFARRTAELRAASPRTYLGFTNWWAPILFAVSVAGFVVGAVGLVLSLT